mmetsp:Transcript_1238/g.2173  ORF Transcript_1238/g.2173 Transcript_1238/m.2173 type:complete len:155 (+) Transcript_1238:54-518(+)
MSFKRPLQYLNHIKKIGKDAAWKELRQTKHLRLGGQLKGTDKFGNQYFEDKTAAMVRDRWILYKDPKNYDATQIPPEWHQWLHNVSDALPPTLEKDKPFFSGEYEAHKTGGMYQAEFETAYAPHNFLFSKEYKNNYTSKDPVEEFDFGSVEKKK